MTETPTPTVLAAARRLCEISERDGHTYPNSFGVDWDTSDAFVADAWQVLHQALHPEDNLNLLNILLYRYDSEEFFGVREFAQALHDNLVGKDPMTLPSEPEPTYRVSGGQGRLDIGRGLSFDEAVRLKTEFDEQCFRAGIVNPPTLITKER